MSKLVVKFPKSAAPFRCPLAPFVQQLSPAFRRVSDLEFFPEGIFLTSKEKAAGFFSASVDTLDKWIAKGLITPYKRGRVYFFPVSGLAQALNHPGIMAFVRKKAMAPRVEKKSKPSGNNEVKYWIEPAPDGKFMFILIRFRGINITWFCKAIAE